MQGKLFNRGDYRLKTENSRQSSDFFSNDPKRSDVFSEVRNPTYQRKGMESIIVSDPSMLRKSVAKATSKIDSKPLSKNEQYNLSLNQEKALNEPNFITLGKISEEEKIQIIQRGFQLQAEGKISLKKYYEGTETDSLFQLKGYRIKYEAIRKNKFYQSLKA